MTPRGSCPWEALPAPRAARQPCGGGAGLPQTEAAPRGAPAPCTHSTSLSWSRARHGRPPPQREQAAGRIRDRFTARGRFGGQETSTHVLRGPRRPNPEPDEAPTDTKPRASVLGERRTSPRQTPQHANRKPRIERTHSGDQSTRLPRKPPAPHALGKAAGRKIGIQKSGISTGK